MRSQKYLPHFVIGILLMVCFLCVARPLGVSSLAQSNDVDAIRGLVQKLFESYQKKDLDKLISHWSEKSSFLAENKNTLQSEFSAYEKIVVENFDIRQTKIEGDKATLRVVAEMALTRARMAKPTEKRERKNRTIELVNEGGVWKIWKLIASEETLAVAIIAANTEEERQFLVEKEPELITSELATILARLNTSNIAYKKGYQHALAINQLASKLAEKIGDQLVMGMVLYNSGYIYGWLGAPEKSPERALGFYGKSLKIGEEFGFSDLIIKSLLNSAMIYDSLGDQSHALDCYEKSFKLAEESGDVITMAHALNNLGNIYRIEGKFAKALEAMLKSLKLSESRPVSGSYKR
jgi:tetratricopeptide (TPR) repeat protein